LTKELSFKNSFEQADLIKPVLVVTDTVLNHLDIEYLQAVKSEMDNNLRKFESVSFLVAPDGAAEKRESELKTFDALMNFLIARKEQQLKVTELFEKSQKYKEFESTIKNILG